MRESTQKKLFKSESEFTVHWSSVSDSGLIFTHRGTDKASALIMEFADEKNGFDVYIRSNGNSIVSARQALGLES